MKVVGAKEPEEFGEKPRVQGSYLRRLEGLRRSLRRVTGLEGFVSTKKGVEEPQWCKSSLDTNKRKMSRGRTETGGPVVTWVLCLGHNKSIWIIYCSEGWRTVIE